MFYFSPKRVWERMLPLSFAVCVLLFLLTLPSATALETNPISKNEASILGFVGPSFDKNFLPSTIGPGSVSTLIFQIVNSSPSPVTDLAFTDNMPVGMTVSGSPNIFNECDGVVTATAGSGTISLTDGRVEGSAICQIMVNITSSTPGVHSNTTGVLFSSEAPSGGDSANADLTVVTTLPGFSKSFSPSSISMGDRSTLSYSIDNTLNASSVGSLDFSDSLPEGIVVAGPNNASTDCISASAPDTTLTATPGTSLISLDANGSVLFPGFEVLSAGATCTVTVDVIATGAGLFESVSSDLLADFTSSGKAAASLEASSTELHLIKSFTNDPIPPGNNVTLQFDIQNFNRSYSATGVSFTDDLSALVPALAGITFDSLLSNDCGGSISGVGGTTIGLSGGTVGAGVDCTIQVSLSIPLGAAIGAYENTTSTITGNINSSPVVGNMATETLFVEPIPILTKEFLEAGSLAPDPVLNPGDDVIIRFTVTNTSLTSGATDITFTDELTDGGPNTGFLPFPISGLVVPTDPCGGGSTITNVFPDTERQGIRLNDGSLTQAGVAGDSCTFDVQVTIPSDMPPGTYSNTTQNITATVDGATRQGHAASDTLRIVSAPTLTKEFVDDPVPPGGTATLEFTLTYPDDANGNATDISFTDDLASVLAGLTATLPPTPDPPCGAGSSLTGSVGDTFLTLTDGTLSPGESCTFSVVVNVPGGTAPGNYTNTTSSVSATVESLSTISNAATDNLNVTGIVFTKEFVDDPVIPGETVTLRFSFENIHPTDDATGMFFTDNLSGVLTGLAATGPASVDTCGGSLSGTNFLIYVGGSLLVGESCSIEVELLVPVSSVDGTYLNLTSNLTATQGGVVVIDPATDTLIVDSNLLSLSQTFTDDPVAPGDSVTMEFVLTNLDDSRAASSIDFTNDLDAALSGLQFDSTLSNSCGGTVTGVGTGLITVTGASLTAGGSCTIQVSLSVPGGAAAGIYPNTTSDLTGTIAGFDVTGDAASDDLEVIQLLTFTHSFDGPTTPGGSATITFNITNPGADIAESISFSDDLDSVVTGLVATNWPAIPCGEGSSITGTSFLTFTGGELLSMGGTCTFDVDVRVPFSATPGTFPNTTSDLFQSGLKVADPATANLIIEPPDITYTYLPVMLNNFIYLPDLVITSIVANGDEVTVVIENQGNAPSRNDYWVDVYFNPSVTPSLNVAWQDIAPAGAVWGVTQDLLPGESLTLTIGDEFYNDGFSSDSFPSTASVYGFVDSIDLSTSYGAEQESDEVNNLFGPVTYSKLE